MRDWKSGSRRGEGGISLWGGGHGLTPGDFAPGSWRMAIGVGRRWSCDTARRPCREEREFFCYQLLLEALLENMKPLLPGAHRRSPPARSTPESDRWSRFNFLIDSRIEVERLVCEQWGVIETLATVLLGSKEMKAPSVAEGSNIMDLYAGDNIKLYTGLNLGQSSPG